MFHPITNSIICFLRDLLTSIRRSNKFGRYGRRSIMTHPYHSGLLCLPTGIRQLHIHLDLIESLHGLGSCDFSSRF